MHPVVPPGLTRPYGRAHSAHTYHMPALDYGVPAPSPILRQQPFLFALRSPFGSSFSAAIPPPAALCRKRELSLLTLLSRMGGVPRLSIGLVHYSMGENRCQGKTWKKQNGAACPGRGNAPALLSGGASPQKRKPIFPHKSSHTAALQCGCFIRPGIIHSFAQGHPWLCFRQSGASVPP